MSFVLTEANKEFAQSFSKSFISTTNFSNEFYLYTAGVNASYRPIGTFSLVTSNAALCPTGRVLHCTGKRLYPATNPMTTFVGKLAIKNVPVFLLSVYDPITFLTGFIDPTSTTFAKYDQNLPNFNDLGPVLNGVTSPSIASNGSLVAQTFVAGAVNNISLYAAGLIGGAYANTPNADCFLNPYAGNVFTLTIPACNLGTSSGVLVFYVRDPANPGTALASLPKGQMLTLIVTNNAGRAVPITFSGTIFKFVNSGGYGFDNSLLPNGLVQTITFVSDGTNLWETSAVRLV
jgi:hypothetical protein